MLRSYDADGYIYCCGNRFMPPAVQKSLTQCFIKGKKVSPEVAEEKVVDMYIKGRYNVGESARLLGLLPRSLTETVAFQQSRGSWRVLCVDTSGLNVSASFSLAVLCRPAEPR